MWKSWKRRALAENKTDYSKYRFSWQEYLLCFFKAFFAIGAFTGMFYRSWLGMLAFPAVWKVLYGRDKKNRIQKRKERLSLQFKDTILMVTAGIQAGSSIENAFLDVEREIGVLYGQNSEMGQELALIRKGLTNRVALEQMLLDFGRRSGIEEIRDFTEVFATARHLGGNLKEMIQRTADLTGQRSRDGTLRVARELHAQDPRVRYVSFSRNFGKEAGIYAGLQAAKGDYVATMDADLQDPPALLPQMLDTLLTGEYDCAATRRTTRKGEPPLRSWFARKFYQIINKMSDTEIVDGARDFRLMSRKMTDAVLSMAEYNRFSKGIFSWVGFKTKWFDYENIERVAGTTKWNFWGLFKYSIEGIVGFSTTPLLIAAGAGVLFCILAFIGILFVVVRALMFGDPTSGWPSMVCIILLCSGVQLFCTGIVGEYLAKTYLEVKHRPIYIVAETEEDKK